MYKQNNENQMQVFNFESEQIRTIIIENEIYFIGKDVAEVLGYADTNQAVRTHVFDKNKLTRQFNGSGQSRQMTIINEAGMYQLIFKSKLDSAERFQNWVTSEVLPTIRRHGAYMTTETIEKTLQDPDFIIKMATQLKTDREARLKAEAELMQANNVLQSQAPKMEFYDAVLSVDNVLNTTTLAKELGITGAKRLNPILIDMRLQYIDRRGEYRPTEEAMKKEIAFLKENIIQCKVRFQLCWKMQAVELIRSKLVRRYGEDYAKIINSSKVGDAKRKGEAS